MTIAELGTLTIADRAVERIAAHAATEVEGIGETAKASAKVDGGFTTLGVRLSVEYPLSVAKTTERAREHLLSRIEEYTGLTVSRMDITVTSLDSAAAVTRRVL
ncbi:Asp23/Gls24 family envelope stress response protein [Amycolatopsis sp. cg5]|uniref:Asp23/Gls24 family envelope stress response protein n=1 Tax=Amycolatopsis sp. cg5 TaxID=3238802 RepID=UPI003523B8F5